jgi:methylated-DNA-[protein]-cysteine S-methyltransferase
MNCAHFRLERIETPIGLTFLVTDEAENLHAVSWDDEPARLESQLERRHGARIVFGEAPRPSNARRALEAYFDGDLCALDGVRTQTRGTDFQLSVWQALRRIPPGETTTYGELAVRIGRPGAMRAVGMANGANPIPVVVPCHRVIGANASLTGFGGGLDRKRWLLAHEGVDAARWGGPEQAVLL